ncbi:hypothetical protein ACHWQZ_G010992 [Mnemiopsis leidyi]
MGITETWLKGYITDAQVQVKNYTVFRSDRDIRKNGGALLYVHNSYIVSDCRVFGDQYCNGIMLKIDDLNCLAATIYRPPECPTHSFRRVLDEMQAFLDDKQEENCEVYVTGDFNLPHLDWSTMTICNTLGKTGKESAMMLLDFMSKNFLSQVIHQPTRGNNILDLVLTNRTHLICETKSTSTCLSDHNIVSVVLGYDARRNANYGHRVKEAEDFSYFNLNLMKADLEQINNDLKLVDWDYLFDICQPDADGSLFAELIRLTVLQTCYMHAPTKDPPKVEKRPRVSRPRRILHRKRKKLKGRLNSLKRLNPDAPAIKKLEEELFLLAYEIQENIRKELTDRELKAVECVKNNPKYFFSYAKRFSKLKSNIGPLRDTKSGILHHDPQTMADILQTQYSSVFSDPGNPKKRNTLDKNSEPSETISGIEFTEEDIISAIDEIDPESATSDGDIPAKILKFCKRPLSHALFKLWKCSYEVGKIPQVYKEQFITPVYKKGNKTEPANYRPVSLTSHVIKVFERIIRKNLVDFLEKNNLFSSKQHGFRKGRSCLTQLLQHMDFLFQNFLDNSETDVIYLDYAKAFDKVDHSILLEKIKAYGIEGKVYTWIEQFLCGRTQTVIVDGKKTPSAKILAETLPFMAEAANYTTPNGTTIDRSPLVRDLGVNMSEDLSWTPHINIMVDKARQISSWVLGVFRDRSKPVMLQLYKSLIRSRVEYCCPLWNPTKIADIQLIESIQRQFTRRIRGFKDTNYWDRLKELNLCSLQRRRERYMIIHVWKILQGICPNDIGMVFRNNPRLGIKIVLPSLSKKASALAMSYYDSSFSVRAGMLWNLLPREVNTLSDLNTFKISLGTFMDNIPDTPPTPGYTAKNSNSMIDWCSQEVVRRWRDGPGKALSKTTQ